MPVFFSSPADGVVVSNFSSWCYSGQLPTAAFGFNSHIALTMNYLHTRLGGFPISPFPGRFRRDRAELHRSLHIPFDFDFGSGSLTAPARRSVDRRRVEPHRLHSPLRRTQLPAPRSRVWPPSRRRSGAVRPRSRGLGRLRRRSGEWAHCRRGRTSIRICTAC